MHNSNETFQWVMTIFGILVLLFLAHLMARRFKNERDGRTNRSLSEPLDFNANSLLNRVVSINDRKEGLLLIEIDDDDFYNSRLWIKEATFPISAAVGDRFLVQLEKGKLFLKGIWFDSRKKSYIFNPERSIAV